MSEEIRTVVLNCSLQPQYKDFKDLLHNLSCGLHFAAISKFTNILENKYFTYIQWDKMVQEHMEGVQMS
jgi:hypothetical protein